jgi:4-hydroxybutyryl-CoA dehydratase / vinylacetyl-CoA-Delta-isomerase
VRHLQDIAGGAVVSAPTLADAENPEIGALVDKYFAAGGGLTGRERLRLFHAVRDLSADAFGGYRAVGSLHGAGGLHAQRLVARKSYDTERVKAEVRSLLADPGD